MVTMLFYVMMASVAQPAYSTHASQELSEVHQSLRPMVATLLKTFQDNHVTCLNFKAVYRETRFSKVKNGSKEMDLRQHIDVEETRCNNQLLVRRKHTGITVDGLPQPEYESRVVQNDDYVAELKPPHQFVSLWEISGRDVDSETVERGRMAARVPSSPSRYGFGDGDDLLPHLLDYGMTCPEFDCRPSGQGEAVYVISMEDHGLRRVLWIDALKGALIVKAEVYVDGDKRRELTVTPGYTRARGFRKRGRR